jgi:hypothetical protein
MAANISGALEVTSTMFLWVLSFKRDDCLLQGLVPVNFREEKQKKANRQAGRAQCLGGIQNSMV